MDLIERLHNAGHYTHVQSYDTVCTEAAEEIERLQAQITAMTKDMDSMKPWRELSLTNKQLEGQCEELRILLADARAESRAYKHIDSAAIVYLSEVRAIVGGDDLSDMVKRVAALKRENDELIGRPVPLSEWEELKRENDELRAELSDLAADNDVQFEELAALKAQSTEQPVAWTEQTFFEDGTPNPCSQLVWAGENDCDDFPIGTRFYLHPPKQESTEQPVANIPKTAQDIRDFIGVNYNYIDYKFSTQVPTVNDEYNLTAHDLLSAFSEWAESTTPPTATALVEDFKRRAVEAMKNERVDSTGSEEDEAYNAAIFHAVKAIESLPLIEGE